MFIALAVGLVIALFQALTQLQEMTLVFVPKIIVVFVTISFITVHVYDHQRFLRRFGRQNHLERTIRRVDDTLEEFLPAESMHS